MADTYLPPSSLHLEDAKPKRKSSVSSFASKAKSFFSKKLTTPKDSLQKIPYPRDGAGSSLKGPKCKTEDLELGHAESDSVKIPRKPKPKKIEGSPYEKRDICGIDDVGKVPVMMVRKPIVDQENLKQMEDFPMPDFSKIQVPEDKLCKDYIDEDDTMKVPAPEVDQKVNVSLAPDTTETAATKSTAAAETMQAKFTEDESMPSVMYFSRSAPPSEASGKQRDRIVDVLIEVPNLSSEQEPEVLQENEPSLLCPCESVFGVLCHNCYRRNFNLLFNDDEDDDDEEELNEESEEGEATENSTVDEEDLESETSEESDQSESLSDSDWYVQCSKCNKELERRLAQLNNDSDDSDDDTMEQQLALLRNSSAILRNYDEECIMDYFSEDENDYYFLDSSEKSEKDSEAECNEEDSEDEENENVECESSDVNEQVMSDEETDDETDEMDEEAAELDEDELKVLAEEEDEELDEEDEDLEDEDMEVYLDTDGVETDEDEETDIFCPSCYSDLFQEVLADMGFIYVGNHDQPMLVLSNKDTQEDTGAQTSAEGAPAACMDADEAASEDVSAKRTAETSDESYMKTAKQALACDIDTLTKKDGVFVKQAEKLAKKVYGAGIADFDVQFNFRAPNIENVFQKTTKTARELAEVSIGADKPELSKSTAVDENQTKPKLDSSSAGKGSDSLEWDDDLEWCVVTDTDEDDDSSFLILNDTDDETDGVSDLSQEIDPTTECNPEESTTQPEQKTDLTAVDSELLEALFSKDEMFAIKLDNLVRETYGKDSTWEFEATHKLNREIEEAQAEEQEVNRGEADYEEVARNTEERRLHIEVESDYENAPQNAAPENLSGNVERRLHIEVESDDSEQVVPRASESRIGSESVAKVGADAVFTKGASDHSSDSGMASAGSADLSSGDDSSNAVAYTSEDSNSSLELGARGQGKLEVPEDEFSSISTDYTDLSVEYDFENTEPASDYSDHDLVVETLEDRFATPPSSTCTIDVILFTDSDYIGCCTDPCVLGTEKRQGKEGNVYVAYSIRPDSDYQRLMHQIDPDMATLPPSKRFVLAARALSQIMAPHRVTIVLELPPDAPPHVRTCYRKLYKSLKNIRANRFRPLKERANRIYEFSPPLPYKILETVRGHCKSALVSLERVGNFLEGAFRSKRGKPEALMARWYAKKAMDYARADMAKVLEKALLPVHVRRLLFDIIACAECTLERVIDYPDIGVETLLPLRESILKLLHCLTQDFAYRSVCQTYCLEYLNMMCDGLLYSVFFTPVRVSVRHAYV